MRALWITLALTLAPGLTKADVVYSVTSAGSGASLSAQAFNTNSGDATGTGSGTYDSTIGQSFQNIGQSAFVDSVNFRLRRSTTTAFTAGTLKVGIYAVTGTSGLKNFAPTGPALISSSTINASTITNTATDYAFSGFGTSSSLSASTNYMALLTWSGIDFGTSNLEVALFLGAIPSSSTYENYNLASNGSANSTQQMYGTINVSAVPEPGTLLLGGIAAACGGGGAWWRRKRHQASKATAQESVA